MNATQIKALLSALVFLCMCSLTSAQVKLSTKGKDFWFTVMPNFGDGTNNAGPSDSVLLTLSSEHNTSGTVENPALGYSVPFTINAFTVTEITIPNDFAVSLNSQIVDSTSIHILAEDTITAFVASMNPFTRDATNLIPSTALGKEYMVTAYSSGSLGTSQFCIVATEDSTVLEITPSVETHLGDPAGVSFNITLNRGQTYLVQAANQGEDLTGSTVSSVTGGTTCSNYAVFAGSSCTQVPTGCIACDQVFSIVNPLSAWGHEYLIAPFQLDSLSAYRVTARYDNTPVYVDGILMATLNSGEYYEVFHDSNARCITSDSLITVTQFMQGVGCSTYGDPAMLSINSTSQGVRNAIFTTVDVQGTLDSNYATIITHHDGIDDVTFNSVPIDSDAFIQFPFCTDFYYTYISLPIGAHVVQSSELFSIYIYGMTNADSYAYSAGAFVPLDAEYEDITCAGTSHTFTVDSGYLDAWWYRLGDPDDTLGTGLSLTLNPSAPAGIYVYAGFSPISGCREERFFRVDPPRANIGLLAQSSKEVVCPGEAVNLSLLQRETVYENDFEDTLVASQFSELQNVLSSSACGTFNTDVLTFNGSFERSIATFDFDASLGGFVECWVSVGQNGCDPPDSNDLLLVEYSINGGGVWNNLATLEPEDYPSFQRMRAKLPTAAQTTATRFRLREAGSYLAGEDVWIVDDWKVYLAPSNLTDSLTWTPGPLVSDSTIEDPIGSPQDSTFFTVYLRDSIGCTFSDSVLVVQAETLTDPVDFDTVICAGNGFTFTASAGDVYQWSPPEGISDPTAQTVVIQPAEEVLYEVEISDEHACDTVFQFVNIGLAEPGHVPGFTDTTICDLQLLSFEVNDSTGGTTVEWSDGSTKPRFVISGSGTFWYRIENVCGVYSDTIEVVISDPPVLDLGPDRQLCPGQREIVELPLDDNTYTWSDGSEERTRSFSEPGTHVVTVRNELGCTTQDSIRFIDDCATTITYPNVFTPNGDGWNDFLFIHVEYATDVSIVIMNRWGQRVFHSNGVETKWDGFVNGELVSEGVYYLLVTYLDRNGEQHTFKGDITVLY